MELFFLVFIFIALVIAIDFLAYLFTGRRIVRKGLFCIAEVFAMVIMPFMYVAFFDETTNNCCGDSAVFSPDHRVAIYTLIIICVIAYFYSSFRKKMAGPLTEIIVNALLLICIVLNVFIIIQINDSMFTLIGNVPIIMLAILMLAKNHQLFIEWSMEVDISGFENAACKILSLKPIYKFPILFILCLPVLVILASLLLIVGQKPDSFIRAFTDTYKHGFSQWDYQCDNVQCGGHYLCSVAANGHKKIVKPKRFGVRNGGKIICNRQLLVSNAFEELLQERLPLVHKIIRKQYNKVGNVVHRYYNVFNIKWFADLIYVLMKPLEFFFLLILYLFDRKPENRIAKQYLSIAERKILKEYDNRILN